MLIPVILGSHKDLVTGNTICSGLRKHGLDTIIRICSAHKYPVRLLNILKVYNSDDNVLLFITVAGKSNALSALIDGSCLKPVIACPPLKHETMYDLYSSVSMPTGVAPLLILNPSNAVLAVLKICSLVDTKYRDVVKSIQNRNKNILRIEDIRHKYDFNVSEETHELKIPSFLIDHGIYSLGNLIRKGKIRDLYSVLDQNNNECNMIGLVATNRLSGFDRQLGVIARKGEVLNDVSGWWFNKTSHIVPNHIIKSDLNRISIVKKCKVFPIEFVVRSYMTGSTNTSIWQNYRKGARYYCGHNLRDGYNKNDRLDDVILTPTTKSDIHDELISEDEIIERGIMTSEHWKQCKEYALTLFKYGQKICAEKGLILVDTKYEFGLDEENNVLLIDEVHTPDSSRYWIQHNYEERIKKGLEPDHIDKEFIRKWVKNEYGDPYSVSSIKIPKEMCNKLSNKYLLLRELITED